MFNAIHTLTLFYDVGKTSKTRRRNNIENPTSKQRRKPDVGTTLSDDIGTTSKTDVDITLIGCRYLTSKWRHNVGLLDGYLTVICCNNE